MEKNNYLKLIFITNLFILIGTILSVKYIFYQDFSFSVLSRNLSRNDLKSISTQPILEGQKVNMLFKAHEPYLSLVGIRFNTYGRENDDYLIFRIKEKGQSKWYHEQQVRTTFAPDEIYNFGFPSIDDSSQKLYIVEIQSRQGTPRNSVSISSTEPAAVTRYKYPRSLLVQNPSILMNFIVQKVSYHLQSAQTRIVILLFFVPSLVFPLSKKNSSLALSLFYSALVIDILFIKHGVDDILLYFFIFWLILLHKSNSNISISLITSLILLSATIPLVIAARGHLVIKLYSWAFMLLLAGLLQAAGHNIFNKMQRKHA